MRRKVACRSIASGVVRSTCSSAPPTIRFTVPSRPGLDARALEDVADQEGRRRLAVRARDARDPQLGGRVAVEARRGVRHRRAGVADDRLDHVRLEVERGARRRRRDAPAWTAQRGELVAVGGVARGSQKKRAPGPPCGCRRRGPRSRRRRRRRSRSRRPPASSSRSSIGAILGALPEPTPAATAGGIRRYGSANLAISPNAGAATVPP